MPQKNSILFAVVVPTSTEKGRNERAKTENLAELLSLPTADTDVASKAKPNYAIGAT